MDIWCYKSLWTHLLGSSWENNRFASRQTYPRTSCSPRVALLRRPTVEARIGEVLHGTPCPSSVISDSTYYHRYSTSSPLDSPRVMSCCYSLVLRYQYSTPRLQSTGRSHSIDKVWTAVLKRRPFTRNWAMNTTCSRQRLKNGKAWMGRNASVDWRDAACMVPKCVMLMMNSVDKTLWGSHRVGSTVSNIDIQHTFITDPPLLLTLGLHSDTARRVLFTNSPH